MKGLILPFLSLLILSACEESVFIAKVEKVREPMEQTEVTVEKVESDHLYTQFFAVYDTLLISSCPSKTEDNFYVVNIKGDELLGSFMHRGQGPGEFPALTPISRIERKGNDLTALTYGPFNHQLMEWNITRSLELGRDSIIRLGYYKDPDDSGPTYAKIFRLGKSKYVGYTSGATITYNTAPLLPTYWILEEPELAPVRGISFINKIIRNIDSVVPEESFFCSEWYIKPDNSKIVNVMGWLEQINIIDLTNDKIASYRVKGSPGENIFNTDMRSAERQYHDVVCNDSSIYVLYIGETNSKLAENHGAFWIHKYDWEGKFIAKYHLPVPILRLWLDPANNTLYGYNEEEDVLYRLDIDR